MRAADPHPADVPAPAHGDAPAGGADELRIGVLGTLDVRHGRQAVALGAAMQRAVFAMLALEANVPVTADRLIEGLWGQDPPPSGRKLIQVYVSKLRKALADAGLHDAIRTERNGYRLHVDPDGLDVVRCERLIHEAADALESGRASGAARAALDLFRAPPLCDLSHLPFADEAVHRMEELRLGAMELAIEEALVDGRHRQVLPELDALLAEHPLREGLHAQRMLALYRSGRQADALDAYREARRLLVEAIGVEPGPELRRLHERILQQDAALDVTPVERVPRTLEPSSPLLAGRDLELRELLTAWRSVRGGDTVAMLVTGVAGVGKTRLAAEVAHHAHRDRAPVLHTADGDPLDVIARARALPRSGVVVVDDLDRLDAEVAAAAASLLDRAEAPLLAVITARDAERLPDRIGALPRLELGALDETAVRLIAELYGDDERRLPAGELLLASRGIPLNVHRVAAEWTRDAIRQRVEAAVDETAARAKAHEARHVELAEDLLSLQALGERERRYTTGLDAPAQAPDVRCPFKGLTPFDTTDRDFFFGREPVVAESIARLVESPILAVVGPSGCGKSSILRAGILPALRADVLPGSERWTHAVFRPGDHPDSALEEALATRAPDRRLVLAIDQFEEAFAARRDPEAQRRFLDLVCRTARDDGERVVTVVTIRGDAYGQLATHPGLAALLARRQVLVGPMTSTQLRRAIELPARHAGLEVEPALVDALVADCEGEAGALPLLSSALLELWQRRDGRVLRLDDYKATGGVRSAVASLAEDAYASLPAEDRARVRAVMLRLTSVDEAGVLRRRAGLEELGDAALPVVTALADRRLVTVSAGRVELAHEALVSAWPRLRAWLEEDVEGRRIHVHLMRSARDWAQDRDPAELYKGGRLAAAVEWAATHGIELSPLEDEFLRHSQAAGERDARRARAQNRRLRALLAASVALLAVAVGATAVAVIRGHTARREATVAEADRLGAQALLEGDLVRSLLLARQAVALDDSPATNGNLFAALLRHPAAIGAVTARGQRPLALDLSADGRRLAVGDATGLVELFDARTLRPLGMPLRVRGSVRGIALGAGGAPLAVASDDGAAHVSLVDPDHPGRVREIGALGQASAGGVALAPDGRTVAAAWLRRTRAGDPDGAVVGLWDARTGTPRGRLRGFAGAGVAPLLAFARDGDLLLAMDDEHSVLFDVDAETTRTLPVGGVSGSVSPDGRRLVAGQDDGAVNVVDLDSGATRRSVGPDLAPVLALDVVGDGSVAGAADGVLTVRHAPDAAVLDRFSAHAGAVLDVEMSPGGETAFSAGSDGRIIAWDIRGDRRLYRRIGSGAGAATVPWFAQSPDGHTLAIVRRGGPVRLVDARRDRLVGSIPGRWLGVAFSPDGALLATAAGDGRVVVWNRRPLRRVAVLRGDAGLVLQPAFARQGDVLLTGGPRSVRVWDVRRRRAIGAPWRFGDDIASAAIDPDGRRLAIGLAGGSVEVWDVERRRQVTRRRVGQTGWTGFSADGRLLLTGGVDGILTVLRTGDWRPVATRRVHPGILLSAAVSPSGALIATTGSDGARLWDAATLRPVGPQLPGPPNRAAAAAFSPDGSRLVVVYDTGDAFEWDISPQRWASQACAVAGRTLTRREWAEFMPRRAYAPACRDA